MTQASLLIEHFIFIHHARLELHKGLCAITGETGAGKSMLFQAIGFVLGQSASVNCIAKGQEACSITLTLPLPAQHPLRQTDSPWRHDTLISIKRRLTRSKQQSLSINGHACKLSDLRGHQNSLMMWQAQHAHVGLQDTTYQRKLLDQHVDAHLLQSYQQLFSHQQNLEKNLATLKNQLLDAYQERQHQETIDLLTPLADEDAHSIQAQYQEYQNNENKQADSHAWQGMLSELEAIEPSLNRLEKWLPSHTEAGLEELTQGLRVHHSELSHSLHEKLQRLGDEQERQQALETTIARWNQLSKKLMQLPEALPAYREQLQQALSQNQQALTELEDLQVKSADTWQQLQQQARLLSAARQQAAEKLAKAVNAQLPEIGLRHGQLRIDVEATGLSSDGADRIVFRASMNPEQPLHELKKLSGGELARCSLLVHLLSPSNCPLWLLDEVDTGISGQAAARVGQLLERLSKDRIMLCISHNAPMAAKAHHHLHARKHNDSEHTESKLTYLDGQARIEAIACLISQDQVDQSAKNHAEKLLERQES